MTNYIVIRQSRTNDIAAIDEVVRGAYLSNAFSCWCNALTKEITFQLIVVIAAVMFIFIGVPLAYCLAAIPVVLLLIFVSVYLSLLNTAVQLCAQRPLYCWVAELCQSSHFFGDPQTVSYVITTEEKLRHAGVVLTTSSKKIVGTVAVSTSRVMEHSNWLFKLAVEKSFRNKGVGMALVKTAQNWAKDHRYDTVHLVLTECQENARHLFSKAGFEMKQMYHKQLFGSIIMLSMYQLEYEIKPIL